jgi:WD40 repeat protein
MKEYQPLSIKKFSKKSYKSTELKRIKKFKEDKAGDLKHTANTIKICQAHSNIVTFFAFDKIFHYDLTSEITNEKYPQLTDVITAGNVRKDGKIIYAGLANGVVNIYDAGKKLCLRSYSGYHKLQINSIDIADNLTHFVTSSNDLSFKIFETSRLEPLYSFDKVHSDYINITKFVDENIIISGGNDKIIKLWDIRSSSGSGSSNMKRKPVKTFDNMSINSDILILNTRDRFISTAENNLNMFDLRSDKMVYQINPMQSSIKKIVADFTQSRLFAIPQGENFVKCIELGKEETPSMKNLFSLKFSKEISAFDISGDMNRYAVGFVDGQIQIKSRNVEEEDEEIYKDQEDKDLEFLE